VYFNGEYVLAGGDSNNLWSSPDGIDWTQRPQSILTEVRGITASGNAWIIVGVGSPRKLAYSVDFINWTANTTISVDLNAIFNNGYVMVAVANGTLSTSIYWSNNITNWNAAPTSASGCDAVTWTGSSWIAGGGNQVRYPQGIITNWSTNSTNSLPNTISGIFTNIYGMYANPRVGVLVPSAIKLKKGDTLGMVTPTYYNGINKGMSFMHN
jgi:hypothetical protein